MVQGTSRRELTCFVASHGYFTTGRFDGEEYFTTICAADVGGGMEIKMEKVRYLKEGYTTFPLVMNLEVTDKCPLNCPYCYKDLERENELDVNFLNKILMEFAARGGKSVLFSGGEPLLYPYIIDAIETCTRHGIKSSLSTSGYGLNEEMAKKLLKSELNFLYISLNSHVQEVNCLSRDGYKYAIEAMNLCKELGIPYRLNTVIRNDNIRYFQELIDFSKEKGALGIELLLNKANNKGRIDSPLTQQDFELLLSIYENNEAYLSYQTCFVALKKYFDKEANKVAPLLKGCSAGRYSMAVFCDGSFAPCPHSHEKEFFDSIKEYWSDSKFLSRYRAKYDDKYRYCPHGKHSGAI